MLRKRVFVFGFAPTKGHGWAKHIPDRNPSNDANFLGKENKQRKAHGEESPSPAHQLRFVNARKPLVSPVSFL